MRTVLRALNLDLGLFEEPGHPPEGKSWGHRAVSRGLAVGPAGMSTTEPESSVGNRSSDLCPLLVLGSPPLVGPHCLRAAN